jgi:predicted transcriptional regulator
MGQITLYLEDELKTRLRAAARAANLSQSRWIANLIAEKLRHEWPETVVNLAGAWEDLPLAEVIRAESGQDSPRELL